MSNTQLDKNYGNDWAKSKSRDLVRGMIQKNLGYKKPQDLKVLCFPGNEATEVKEVYDPLGIPRGNIVGIERDQAVADKIRAQGLGIQVVNQTLEDYVSTQSALDFDVVSLDYTGPINEWQLEALRTISLRNSRNDFVVNQSNLAKRERLTKDLYVAGAMGRAIRDPSNPNMAISAQIASMNPLGEGSTLDLMNSGKKQFEEGEIGTARTYGYSRLISISLQAPEEQCERLKKLARFVGLEEKLIKDLDDSGFSVQSQMVIGSFILNSIKKALLAKGINDSFSTPGIFTALNYANISKSYESFDAEAYSYISESGAPMIGATHYLKSISRSQPEAIELFKMVNFQGRFRIMDKGKLIQAMLKFHKSVKKGVNMDKFIEGRTKAENPVFLGSSARPVLTKQMAIEEFRAGTTVEQVRDKYRGVNGKPLAAWKAHVTMGTYDPKPVSEEVLVEDIEDSDVEKITKEQALDLLSDGVPPKEIYESYPTSFTKMQLAAFKAWITMRSREN